jgi:hypothetical protein
MAYLHLQNKNIKEQLRFLRLVLGVEPRLKNIVRHETMRSKLYML